MAITLDLPKNTITFKRFKGINNLANAKDLELDELREAKNIDLDSEGKAIRRNGYTKKVMPSGIIHSLWSNDRICLFVEGTTLKRLYEDYTSSDIRTNISTLPVSYVDVNEIVYYSNASVIGYIENGVGKTFVNPTKNFKQAPQPGQHIEYYNGRLYIARNDVIWYTDAFNFGHVDMRSNFIRMKDEITMLGAVDDGMYVSIGDITDRSSVLFLSGLQPKEFVIRQVADYGAIEGTDVKVNGSFIGEGIAGKAILWTSRKGVCLGANGGNFTNLTKDKYIVSDRRYGAGLFQLRNGIPQYIAPLWE